MSGQNISNRGRLGEHSLVVRPNPGASGYTTAGPRTVPVRSGLSGVNTLELSRIPRPSDVLRAGTARAPVVVSRCAQLREPQITRVSRADAACFRCGWLAVIFRSAGTLPILAGSPAAARAFAAADESA